MSNVVDAPSRRSVIALAAGAGAVALTAAVAPVITVVATPSADLALAWDRALLSYRQAKAAYDEFDSIFDRKHEAWSAEEPDDSEVNWTVLEGIAIMHPRTLDVRAEHAKLKAAIGKGVWQHRATEAATQLAALEQLHAWQIARAANEKRHGMNAVFDRLEKLAARLNACEVALLKTPAPDATALLWKLEILLKDNDGHIAAWSTKLVGPTLADARRIGR